MTQILLIEDDESITLVCTRSLEALGYEVTTAGDSDAARKAFKAGKFQLIITDLKIPGENGLDLIKYFRSTNGKVPIILTSGFDLGDPAILDELKDLGDITTLSKPFELMAFMEQVKGALGEHP